VFAVLVTGTICAGAGRVPYTFLFTGFAPERILHNIAEI
jgi:hypothetical protein